MFIQTEQTPNPDTLKFIPGGTVLGNQTAGFKSREAAAEKSPLAAHLLEIDGVRSVFFGRDFISIGKQADKPWLGLKTMILAAIMEHQMTGQPIMLEPKPAPKPEHAPEIDRSNPVIQQILDLMETRVRPAVQQDGGDIAFDRFENGIVYLHMMGACSGCPSSAQTLKAGIETLLKQSIPEVEEVRAVQP